MKISTIALASILLLSSACASETIVEKTTAKSNNAVREIKKGINNVKEALCTDSDAVCLAKKVGHKAVEAKDYTKDKISQGYNKID